MREFEAFIQKIFSYKYTSQKKLRSLEKRLKSRLRAKKLRFEKNK